MDKELQDIWILLLKYDKKIFKWPDNLKCSICQGLIIDAVQTPCGCSFCRECIESNIMKKNYKCPGKSKFCKDSVIETSSNLQVDHKMNRLIVDLQSNCPNNSCQFVGGLKEVLDHLKECPQLLVTCPFKMIDCKSTLFTNDTLKEHLQNDVHQHSVAMINLLNDLDEKRKNCDNECQKNKTNQTIMNQKLLYLTDTVEVQKNTIQELKKELKNTTSLNKILENKVKDLTLVIEKMNIQTKNMTSDFEKFESKVFQNLKEIKDKADKKEIEFKNVSDEQRKGMHNLKQEIVNINKLNVDFKLCLKEFQKQSVFNNNLLEQQNHGEFIWKIDNFKQKKLNAQTKNEEITSSSFYSHKNGYKLKLKLNPYGIENGKGQYMFISFFFVPGNFDNILEWPFKETISLSIVNQETKEDYIQVTYNIFSMAEQDRDVFNQPTSEKVGFGTYNFGNIKKMESGMSILKNDTLYIRCVIFHQNI